MEPCEICGEIPEDEEALLHTCVTCGQQGYDTCCMPSGNNTECVDCEQNAEEED